MVDIENTYGKKKLGLISFVSQLHHTYFNTDILDSFHNNYQCCKKGMNQVEQFKIKNLYIK